jgi:hypothetical protein
VDSWAEGHDFSVTASPRRAIRHDVSTLSIWGCDQGKSLSQAGNVNPPLETSPQGSHRLLHYSVLEALLISMSKRAGKKGIACLIMESMWTEHYESNQQSKNNNRILRT